MEMLDANQALIRFDACRHRPQRVKQKSCGWMDVFTRLRQRKNALEWNGVSSKCPYIGA